MKTGLVVLAIGLGVVFWTPDARGAQWCDYTSGGTEETAVEDAYAAVVAGCPCESFDRPGHYRSCVQQVLKGRVGAALLSKVCARQLKSSILPSTCGYPPEAVACVRFKSAITPGRRGCRIVADESRCTAPRGGGACTSAASCFDALGKSYSGGPGCTDG